MILELFINIINKTWIKPSLNYEPCLIDYSDSFITISVFLHQSTYLNLTSILNVSSGNKIETQAILDDRC